MECVNLKTNLIRILEIHYSYNRTLENDGNYRKYIIKIERLLKLWKMQQLTLIFKAVAISKVLHRALVRDAPSSTVAQLEKIRRKFLEKWKS